MEVGEALGVARRHRATAVGDGPAVGRAPELVRRRGRRRGWSAGREPGRAAPGVEACPGRRTRLRPRSGGASTRAVSPPPRGEGVGQLGLRPGGDRSAPTAAAWATAWDRWVHAVRRRLRPRPSTGRHRGPPGRSSSRRKARPRAGRPGTRAGRAPGPPPRPRRRRRPPGPAWRERPSTTRRRGGPRARGSRPPAATGRPLPRSAQLGVHERDGGPDGGDVGVAAGAGLDHRQQLVEAALPGPQGHEVGAEGGARQLLLRPLPRPRGPGCRARRPRRGALHGPAWPGARARTTARWRCSCAGRWRRTPPRRRRRRRSHRPPPCGWRGSAAPTPRPPPPPRPGRVPAAPPPVRGAVSKLAEVAWTMHHT